MRTLIVPCAGRRMINKRPLYLNYYPDGQIIGIKAIKDVFPQNYDRIVFTVLKEDVEKYDVTRIIPTTINGVKIEYVVLNERTQGPADTVYKTIVKANITGEISIRDSHAYIMLDKDVHGNFAVGLDLTQYERTIENLRSKSFIIKNEQGQILDIVEKHFSSDIISAGMYGFKDVTDYIYAYEHLKDENYQIDKLYLSHVISYLIGYKERIYHCNEAKRFEDWSTDNAWQSVQNNHELCFLNLDELKFNQDLFTLLRERKSKGAKYIGFTSCVNHSEKIDILNENICEDIIWGCPKTSTRKILNSFD